MNSGFPDPASFQSKKSSFSQKPPQNDDDLFEEANTEYSSSQTSQRPASTNGASSKRGRRSKKTGTTVTNEEELPENPALTSLALIREATARKRENAARRVQKLIEKNKQKTADISYIEEFIADQVQATEDQAALQQLEGFYHQVLQQQEQQLTYLQGEAMAVASASQTGFPLPQQQTYSPQYLQSPSMTPQPPSPPLEPTQYQGDVQHFAGVKKQIPSNAFNYTPFLIIIPIVTFLIIGFFTLINSRLSPSAGTISGSETTGDPLKR